MVKKLQVSMAPQIGDSLQVFHVGGGSAFGTPAPTPDFKVGSRRERRDSHAAAARNDSANSFAANNRHSGSLSRKESQNIR